MKSRLEKTLERTTIGFMTLGTIISIILTLKTCNHRPIPKEQEPQKEIETYNTICKELEYNKKYVLHIDNSYKPTKSSNILKWPMKF